MSKIQTIHRNRHGGMIHIILVLLSICIIILIILSCKKAPEAIGKKPDHQSDFATEQALASDIAANTIGVNTHINYTGSIYDTHYENIIQPRLVELGIRHIRDHFGASGGR